MVQCDGVDNRHAKSDAVPTLLERKRRDMEVKVVMTGTTVQGHDTSCSESGDFDDCKAVFAICTNKSCSEITGFHDL